MANILVPIAGRAQRFVDAGFPVPKPLIMVDGKHMIDWAFDSIKYAGHQLIFLVRKDHVAEYSIDEVLRSKFGSGTKIIIVDEITQGTLCTCLLAKDLINNDEPLVIYTPDVYFQPAFDVDEVAKDIDGLLLTFKANSPDHSYAKVDHFGQVVQTAEKEVISDQAAVGVYYFRSGRDFVIAAEVMVENKYTTNGEYYVCPIYNLFIKTRRMIRPEERPYALEPLYHSDPGVPHNIKTQLVEKMHVLGTPSDLEFFTKKTLPRFGENRVALCSDHSGVELKDQAKEVLEELGIPFIDFGTYTDAACDHYEFISQAVRHIKDGTCDFGLGFCRTGQGFNIAANKSTGIRSALVFDEFTAEHSVRHNAANFFAIPSQYVDKDKLRVIFEALRNNSFDGGRHMTRIQKIEKDGVLFGR